MVKYECFRCGYITNLRGNLKHHLNRKNICKTIDEDISIELIKKHYGFENIKNYHPNDTQTTPKQHPNDTQTTQNDEPQKTPNDPFFAEKNPKKPQKTPNIPICDYCDKLFSKMCHLRRHEKICKPTANCKIGRNFCD